MLLPRKESLKFVTAMTDFKDIMLHKADFVIELAVKLAFRETLLKG